MKLSKPRIAYKVLLKGMKSKHNDFKWLKGKWYGHEGDLKLCSGGFHASKLLPNAINYVTPGIVCKVEYKGDVLMGDDKLVASEMRVVETYRFTKRMAVEFSIFCARQCLHNYEKAYPDDKKVRLAIEAAEAYLNNPCDRTKEAARSAAESAAWSAARSAALSAARSAAWSAEYAARSAARSAAESAAWSAARSAARSAAESAAWSAARSAESAIKKAQHKKLMKIINHYSKISEDDE